MGSRCRRRKNKRLEERPGKRKYTINDALFSIRRCVGALALLEEHCGISTERCRNCVEKHLLLAMATMDMELQVLKAEEFGREASQIGSQSRQVRLALEKVPKKLSHLASVFYVQIGNRPLKQRTMEHWRKVGTTARVIRRWMQNTFNLSKVAHGMTLYR